MDRRTFLEASAFAASGVALRNASPLANSLASAAPLPADAPMIGIQAGAVSFVDEGVNVVLDNFQRLAEVNTIFLATFTYGRGIGGRQPRGSALPDHGKQEYDDSFHGGNFATPHPQYYRNTSIAPEKAPDHPNYDVIADVRPESPTYGRWVGEYLRAGEHRQLYIPAGCLHGFLSLEDGTILSYKQSAAYDPASEFAVAWDDPTLAIDWPLGGRKPRLSPKDACNSSLPAR